MSVAPAPGDVYNNPPIPADFAGLGITPAILATCHAVTSGPDRNIYWVYDDMKSSATAIQTAVVRGACFETRDSIAFSQSQTGPTDLCSSCRHTLSRHMTAAQATTAFSIHAAGFPATHVRVTTAPAFGVIHPPGTAAVLGMVAPIAAAGGIAAAAGRLVFTANTPSTPAHREDYKLLVSMAAHRDKWTSKTIAHEFMSKLETALRQSPISPVHWIYFLPLMVSENDRNMQDWIEATITSPNLSWNAAKAEFIAHYERADWKDSLLIKYKACIQGHQLVQKYTDRFSALMRHLSIGDADVLNIAHYMNGLRDVIYTKLIEHRSDMRNLPLGGAAAAALNATWDFVSFDYVSSKASSFENELSARDQARDKHPAPARDHHTRAAVPQHKRKQEHKRGPASPRKRVRVPSDLHCKWHPESQSHSTKDCRNPGGVVARTTTSTTTTRAAATTVDKDLSKVECYGCRKFGHYKPDCPHKDQWPKVNSKKTHVAKNKGPKARAASVSFGSASSSDE